MIIKQFKRILFFTIVLLPALGVAQGQTTNPYSYFGIGNTYEQGNIRTLGMGGVNLAVRSNIHISLNNPASYTGIDSLSFVANAGLQSTMATYRTNEQNSTYSSTTIDHLTFAFPITKWLKTSIGLVPYSTVGYEVQQEEILDFNVKIRNLYAGSGGLDRVNLGNAISLGKNFSIGLNTSYYFGRIEHRKTVLFPDSAYIKNTRLNERNFVSGLQFTLGSQLFIPTGKNSAIGLAATFSPEAIFKTKTDYLAITFVGDEVGYEAQIDTIYNWNGLDTETILPYTYGFGISWENKNKLLVAADIMFDNWDSFIYLNQDTDFSDKLKASFGIEFIPTSNTLSNYLKLIHYRFGVRYNKMGLSLNNTELKEYAISVGFGLPLRKSSSILNLGMEIGQSGTIENSLIQERFFKVALGISIRESWFRKGKYF